MTAAAVEQKRLKKPTYDEKSMKLWRNASRSKPLAGISSVWEAVNESITHTHYCRYTTLWLSLTATFLFINKGHTMLEQILMEQHALILRQKTDQARHDKQQAKRNRDARIRIEDRTIFKQVGLDPTGQYFQF